MGAVHGVEQPRQYVLQGPGGFRELRKSRRMLQERLRERKSLRREQLGIPLRTRDGR